MSRSTKGYLFTAQMITITLLSALTWTVNFIKRNWRGLLIGIGVIFILASVILVFKSCNKPEPAKLDQPAILKAEKAIKDQNYGELREVLVETDVKNAEIDANVAKGRVETIQTADEARRKYEAMSNDDIASEIERRMPGPRRFMDKPDNETHKYLAVIVIFGSLAAFFVWRMNR